MIKMKFSEKQGSMLNGVLLMALFACAAFYISETEWIKDLSLSPLIIGIVLGMAYANSLRNHLPETWIPGIAFSAKRILRLGIVLYGFRLSFQDIMAVGLPAVIIDAIVVVVTVFLGLGLGRMMRMDRSVALLTACGSAICGAAAVMGVDGVIKPKPYKTAVAVATVVIFGTLSMFLYPMLYRMGVFTLSTSQIGLFVGSTIHEVAHVVGAGNAMSTAISDNAIIVKMIRVMMLVPVLLVIAFFTDRGTKSDKENAQNKVVVPWFAIIFLLVIAFNSLQLLPPSIVNMINTFDTFLLTMAMAALGAETSVDKFKRAGVKPFLLAFLLWIWLVVGGYYMSACLMPLML